MMSKLADAFRLSLASRAGAGGFFSSIIAVQRQVGSNGPKRVASSLSPPLITSSKVGSEAVN
jgi:hypothetical protein